MTTDQAHYLEHLRRKALEAACVAQALNDLIDYPDQKPIAVLLIKSLMDLNDQLTEGLDKQNLPGGAKP